MRARIVLIGLLVAAVVVGVGTPPAKAATPAFVQARANEITSGSTNSRAFSSANGAGNLIVVTVVWNNAGAVTLSDTRGNAYTSVAARQTWNSSWSEQTFYAKNITAGANTVTATFATSISSFGIIYLHEYSGVDKANPLDVQRSAAGNAAAMSSGAITTTVGGDLLYAAGASNATVTAAGSGWTTRSTAFGNRTQDRLAATAGSYTATATQNSNRWVMHVVAFRPQVSSDTSPPTVPTGLSANASSTTVNLNWVASTDNVGVTGYRVSRDGAVVATSPVNSYSDGGRAPATTYTYRVSALDAAGNESAPSAAVSVTTQSPQTDTTPPSVSVSAPAAGATVASNVTITATASDNVGVTGVQFYVDGTTTGAEDTAAPYGLDWDTRTVANGSHTLTARARDAAGNTTLSSGVGVNVANTSSFQNEILATGFSLPTTLEFLPDGRLLIAELAGRILILPAPYTQAVPTPLLQITNIGSAGVQQGIYDIALDPAFDTNHWFYVFYTLGSPNRDRLSRFTANASVTGTVAGSELVLYQDPQTAHAEHHGGAIVFGNDGALYFTTGEHFTASNAQSLNNPRGKIHRINKDGSIPTDNPFYDGTGPHVDSIWAYGLRNPYRAYYDAPTGRLFVGDVGGNNYSTAREEVDLGAAGANYGWPNSEGSCSAPCTSPIYSYPHNGRDASITGGFVYRGSQFPASYQGSYFFADYTQNWIRRLTFDAGGNVTGVANFEPADGSLDGPYGDIVALAEGPEGALYYLDLGYSDIGGTFGVSKLRRIRYQQANQAPTAVAAANPTSGTPPLAVAFSSAGSLDPEDQPITYSWSFGDGTTSTQANPTHTYTAAGQYTARLTVSDGVSSTNSTPLAISVGNAPTPTILTPADGVQFVAGDVISYSGDATDLEDGTLPASAFTWNIDFLHEGHVHPGTQITGEKSGTLTIPTSGHDFSGNTRYRITLTVVDASGLTSTRSVLVLPTKVDLTFASVPSGRTLYLDGIARATPFVYDTLVGFQHNVDARNQASGTTNYTFASWSDGGAQQHDIAVPTSARTFTATFTAATSPATPTFVQVNSATPQTDQSSVAVPYSLAQTAGDMNVVVVGWNNTTSSITSVTDSAGNVYAVAAPTRRGTGLSQAIYYAKNIRQSAANVVTVGFSGPTRYVDVRVAEYSGLDQANPFDATASNSGSSVAATSGSANTGSAGELIVGAGTTARVFTSSASGFTTRIITTPDGDILADRTAPTAGAYAYGATQTGSGAWVMQAATFRVAGQ